MKKNTTKRSLLASVLALVMCGTMLVGTTFAWFTDSASTAVNKIQAGTLNVELLAEDGQPLAKDHALAWKTTDSEVLWEPNCTYDLEPFQIKNAGTLALKYKIVLKATKIDKTADGKSLLDVIDWTIKLGDKTLEVSSEQIKDGLGNGIVIITDQPLLADKADTIRVTGHMREDAGNDYQGLTIDGFGITVVAAQYTYEHDSESDQYDKDAEYPATIAELLATYGNDGVNMPAGVVITSRDTKGNVTVTLKDTEAFVYFTQVFDMEAARAAREEALKSGTVERYPGENLNYYNTWYRAYGRVHVEMGCDVDLQGMLVTPFTECRTFDGKGHTIKNAKVSGSEKSVGFFADFDVANVKMDGIQVTATGDQYAGVISGFNMNSISNVTVVNSSVTGGRYTGAVVGNCYVDLENCVVENCVLSGQHKVGGLAGYVCREDGQPRYIRNNTLTNVTIIGANRIPSKDSYMLGQVVGHWNARSGGECMNNAVTNVTGASSAIGHVEAGTTVKQ